MSTPAGKPINPLDLSAYVSQKAREQANTERFAVENADDGFRSPYAPKRADAGTAPPQPAENAAEAVRSAYAPKTPHQTRPTELGDLAGRHSEGPRAPEGPSALERHALGEESQRQSAGARPFSNAPGGPDLSPKMSFEEAVKAHPIDLDAAASLQPAHPTGDRYEPPAAPHGDAVMNDRDLERLEASLRWLQRQDTTTNTNTRLPRQDATTNTNTRLPRATPMAPVRGLPPADGRERDRHPGGDVYGGRIPLSLEPERMAPPPRGSRHDSLRWPLRFLIASSVAAPVLYYLSVGGGPAPEPAPPPRIAAANPASTNPASTNPTSTNPTSANPTPVVPPSAPRGQREPLPAKAQDDAPATLAARGEIQPQPAIVPQPASRGAQPAAQQPASQPPASQQLASQPPASQQLASQPPQPARVPEREAVAKLQSVPPPVEAPPPSRPVRMLGSDEIALLIKQGEQFIAAGDVVTARIVFQRAAEAGDPNAAVALGATYDPTVLARLGVVGMAADVEKARSWYQKAENLGSPEAARRLKILANR